MTREFRLFDRRAVLAELGDANRDRLRQLVLLEMVDSTNQQLRRYPKAEQAGIAVLADAQSAGRGRRGRQWHSPPGCNIYLSLGWRFREPEATVSHLPLAVAVCLVRALRRAGVAGPGIKWPNDILVAGRKLAGVLIESAVAEAGDLTLVIGVGVNVRMPPGEIAESAIGQDWTDACSHLSSPAGAGFRDRLCGLILDELLEGMTRYGVTGFDTFRNEWDGLDLLRGHEVRIADGEGELAGRAAGIGGRGGLLVEVTDPAGGTRLKEFFAGEAQVRPMYNPVAAP